eukprot:TRINITY_DN16853_c0_g1_i1.p1 TRINITY_DN16853_c0_g1~~TRINITY_DN16853_c0_g1_i1.p1  ORF type:complete len:214 (-),score=44.65 TRINITY_DN16853_c0_g1_i1:85-696(-)
MNGNSAENTPVAYQQNFGLKEFDSLFMAQFVLEKIISRSINFVYSDQIEKKLQRYSVMTSLNFVVELGRLSLASRDEGEELEKSTRNEWDPSKEPNLVQPDSCVRGQLGLKKPEFGNHLEKTDNWEEMSYTKSVRNYHKTTIQHNPLQNLEVPKKVVVYSISKPCLLYTSDAADDTPCVDLVGRRIIKKKKQQRHRRRRHIAN